jgi:dihydropteroate synthase
MLDEGVTFIDVGAYSSKPNAENVSEEEEQSNCSNRTSYCKAVSGGFTIDRYYLGSTVAATCCIQATDK